MEACCVGECSVCVCGDGGGSHLVVGLAELFEYRIIDDDDAADDESCAGAGGGGRSICLLTMGDNETAPSAAPPCEPVERSLGWELNFTGDTTFLTGA